MGRHRQHASPPPANPLFQPPKNYNGNWFPSEGSIGRFSNRYYRDPWRWKEILVVDLQLDPNYLNFLEPSRKSHRSNKQNDRSNLLDIPGFEFITEYGSQANRVEIQLDILWRKIWRFVEVTRQKCPNVVCWIATLYLVLILNQTREASGFDCLWV